MAQKILSIFIDESGDFGKFCAHSPYYIVTLILHNQNNDIEKDIKKLDQYLIDIGYKNHAIHTAPLIRKENFYQNDIMEKRKKLFNALFNFARKLDITYMTVKLKKNETYTKIALINQLSTLIKNELIGNQDELNIYDKIIIYYDNGQSELTKILISVFNSLYSNVDFRKVELVDYKLFQVADLICTLELIAEKIKDTGKLTNSEKEFFQSIRNFKKNYYKALIKKRLK